MSEPEVLREVAVAPLLEQMQRDLAAKLAARGITEPQVIGIQTGGAWVAQPLAAALNAPLGLLNIAFYRDDFATGGLHPKVGPSQLPFDVEGRHVVLVDDVLHSGRTVRAALNEIFDYGRPASVLLAVLAERDGRALPIAPDVAGVRLTAGSGEHVKLLGPEPLRLVVRRQEARA
jgi:pyrimidine operon attenuation protein/uracil phosphoribosyltransferase